jgi:uncharacterized protein
MGGTSGRAFNQTRQVYLATSLSPANTHWSRLRGLIGTTYDDFGNGSGLWIAPCRGVHTWGMRFPIDVVYLDREKTVIHLERDLRPWRFAPVKMRAASVLELPSQTITESGTRVGDKIEITLQD